MDVHYARQPLNSVDHLPRTRVQAADSLHHTLSTLFVLFGDDRKVTDLLVRIALRVLQQPAVRQSSLMSPPAAPCLQTLISLCSRPPASA